MYSEHQLIQYGQSPYGVSYIMAIKALDTEDDYRAALREIDSLTSAKFGTPEGERLDSLATLVDNREVRDSLMK